MKILENIYLDFDDVVICPKRSTINSRKDVDITRSFKTKWGNRYISGFPVIVSNMYNTGSFDAAKVMTKNKAFCCLHKFYTSQEIVEFFRENYEAIKYTFVSIGESEYDIEKLRHIYIELGYDANLMICYDVANAYREKAINFVKKLREKFPTNVIMAGNVCTADISAQLVLSGADIIKIFIGPGSRCKTRYMTGIGYPTLSSLTECKDACHALDALVCADGGFKYPGDIVKSFCAGADFAMSGAGLFGGTDTNIGEWEYHTIQKEGQYLNIPISYKDVEKAKNLCYGTKVQIEQCSNDNFIMKSCLIHFPEIIKTQEKKRIKIYGMSSKEAQEKHNGGFQDYRASEGDAQWIDYKGTTDEAIKEIAGSVRSAGSYIGAKRLKDFDKCCTFIKVNRIK